MLLETIEIASHSYAALSTVTREIVRQPYSHIFSSRELLLQDRWTNIFQAVLSSFKENILQVDNGIFFESLADYAVSIIVRGIPNAPEHVQKLFPLISSQIKDPNIPITFSENFLVQNLVELPPVYVYSLVLNRHFPGVPWIDEESILLWLSGTIDIPLGTHLPILLSEAALCSLLTTAAFLIYSLAKKQKLLTGVISSMEEFSGIVTSVLDDPVESHFAVEKFLEKLVIYHCASLGRANNMYDATNIAQDIGYLIIPNLQPIWKQFPTYHLLLSNSQYGDITDKSFRQTLEKALGVRADNESNVQLKILVLLDKLFSNSDWHPSDVTEDDARELLLRPIFTYKWDWLDTRAYTSEDLSVAKRINDPSLRMIASASSGDLLDLHMVNLGSPDDEFFCAAAAYWITNTLRGDTPLSSEEIVILTVLLSTDNTQLGLEEKA